MRCTLETAYSRIDSLVIANGAGSFFQIPQYRIVKVRNLNMGINPGNNANNKKSSSEKKNNKAAVEEIRETLSELSVTQEKGEEADEEEEEEEEEDYKGQVCEMMNGNMSSSSSASNDVRTLINCYNLGKFVWPMFSFKHNFMPFNTT